MIKNTKVTETDIWITGRPSYSFNISGNFMESNNIAVEHILLLIEQGLNKQK
jgi:hypothetical protein